jgi:hypothetical protein
VEDRLDLCAWNEIRIDGKRTGYEDPIRIPATHQGELRFSIEAPKVKVIGVKWQPIEVIPGGWLNLGPVGARSFGSTIIIPAERIPDRPTDQVRRPLGRLEVEYEYRGVRYVSPRYVEFDDQTLHFVLDKEWLSFNRYGCDAPVRANYGKSWNMNAFNIPNASRPAKYDGDGDGVPDWEDTLPAVSGTCKDGKVRGVPDSDGDGVCDLARFKTAVFPFMDPRFILGEPEFYEGGDYCPYTPGSPDRSGC